MTQPDIAFTIAATEQEYAHARQLFREYADSLPVDLSFQDFATELDTLEIQYSKPCGALLLAYCSGKAVACVAIRTLTTETAELKRMYVQPEYRGKKIGIQMMENILEIARELHYSTIRLDTLPSMKEAQQLYLRFGFYEIAPYRFNPVEGTVYMEKKLL